MPVRHDISSIAETVAALIRRYGERDPVRLAEAMKILVRKEPMGLSPGCCKGFFILHRRIRHITVNSDLPPELFRLVLAHELGHAVLHGESGSPAAYRDLSFFDTTDAAEYEANLFASELLLPDEEVLAVLEETPSFFTAARVLAVPPELLDFKFRILRKKGIPFDSPFPSRNDFFKNLERSATPDLFPEET